MITPIIKKDNFRVPFNQLLEADIVYIRDIIPHQADVVSLKKLAIFAHYCYESHDLAARCIINLHTCGAVSADAQRRYYESLRVSAGA